MIARCRNNSVWTLILAGWVTHASAGMMNGERVMVGSQLYAAQNANRPWSLNLAGNPPCLYRFEVRPGDRWVGETQAANVERSEVHGPTDASNPATIGAPVWTAYQFRVEPGPLSTGTWVVLGDWHVRPDLGDTAVMSSPWQLELRKDDILVFDVRVSPNPRPVRANAPEWHIYTAPTSIARGRWYSIVSVTRFDWRPKGEGGVTVWLDGTQIVNYHGPFGYDTANPPYFKFGIYRSAAPETLVVDYANVATSGNSQASRIPNPPPVCKEK